MKILRFSRIFLIGLIGFLSLGTIARKQNPILMTQTDPIDFKEKQKEEAEGKKGPPAPSLEFFPRRRFLIQGPVEKPKPEPATVESKSLPQEEDLWIQDEPKSGGEDEFKLELDSDDTWEGPKQASQ